MRYFLAIGLFVLCCGGLGTRLALALLPVFILWLFAGMYIGEKK